MATKDAKSRGRQLLHLVFGGELTSLEKVEFRNLKALDLVAVARASGVHEESAAQGGQRLVLVVAEVRRAHDNSLRDRPTGDGDHLEQRPRRSWQLADARRQDSVEGNVVTDGDKIVV